MKVAFYLNNEDFNSERDFSDLLSGNPGIGGSEYMILLVSYLLTIRKNDIHVRLYVSTEGHFNDSMDVLVMDDMEEAAAHAAKEGFERFVFDHKRISWYKKPFQNLPSTIKIIPWCHCFAFTRELHTINDNPNVGRIISVSREQMDLMRDDRSFCKSDFIYNCVFIDEEQIKLCEKHPNAERKHSVVYMGSLVSLKSFHVLAELWPNILKRVPDAELYVIGSAKIYGDNTELGEYGVAEKSYEDMFMPYLTHNNKILPSVHFLGSLGKEKYEVMMNAKVGVPNPTGKSETFCLCAVEMQMAGCAVTAMQAPGYFDTIYNGYIAKDKKQLEDYIVSLLLEDSPKSYEDTMHYIITHFSHEVIVEEWERLLKSNLQEYLHPIEPIYNISYRYKWLKEILRQIKKVFPTMYSIHYTIESFINKYTKNKHNKLAYHP